MDFDLSDGSTFENKFDDDSDAYSPEKKPKAKAPAKKAAATKPAAKKLTQTTLKTKPAAKKRAKPESDDEDGANSNSMLSTTPPSAKKQKKAPSKKAGGKPLAEIENDSIMVDAPPAAPRQQKSATETYQKLTQLEHIIKRPDTYIGSVERTEQQMWVFNKETNLMENRKVTFVPGLYKIFDEILVNAADNKQRDESMNYIKVTVDRETGVISVENNGRGIPVEIHEKEKLYIPEMIFGHLLTGSNYDDNELKTVGGRNGYGAKLCNVFSTEFTLETQDSVNGKRYKQTWRNNMSKMEKAKITSNKSADFVRVTFTPDYARFGMTGIDDDLEALIMRRVYDMAGTVRGVKVFLNGNQIKLKFKTYCEMYAKAIAQSREIEDTDGNAAATVILEDDKAHRCWEVGFAVSDGSFQQVSFVNNIATTSGGTHVNYIADQICEALKKKVDKTKKGTALKLAHIRNHIFIFVNCLITNPSFTSQTKEQLTTKVSQFGSKCNLTEGFLKKIAQTDAINDILAFAEKKADKMLAKSDGNKRSRISNAKLVDANLAGTRFGSECTLILTEGDSAKSLAVAGRAILDPDRIGVFPLRGKLLNVRDASVEQISKNAEIQNIKQFLGLKHKQVYTDTKGLRYGHLMIMADQDHDGSHIKGLLINFLQVQFPSLLKIPGFFQEFITPIVKVWQGPDPKKPLRLKSFFTQPQYEEWKEAHANELSKWHSKYYKGLGTSSNEDAQVYFTHLDDHLKRFSVMKPEEEELLDLAFSKKKADARKEWLGNFVPGTFLDHTMEQITYQDFVNKELILFSMADNLRSIPSVLDGLKPGQRKVVYACFKGNVVKDQKVAELSGYISQQTAYHHGEASLQQTIIGLAQNFVGSNNINILEPSGNFGSRLAGGSDAASARYIHTRLSPFARRIFSPLDEPNLEEQFEDNKKIEPKVYAPILPMVLANGADGIGTGWSTNIPNYHPLELVKNLKRRMGRLDPNDPEEKPFEPMMPWFRGWKGAPEPAGPNRFQFNGIIRQDEQNPNECVVTELPIRMWTDDFKARLEDIIRAEKGSFIKDYKEYNDHKNVHFVIQMEEKHMKAALEEGLLEKFKLTKQIATSNLVAFDTQGRIRKYDKVEDILEEYYAFRFKMYTERKKHWLAVYHKEYRKLRNQARFVQEIMEGKLVVNRKKKAVLVQELRERKYEAFPKNAEKKKKTQDQLDEDEGDDDDGIPGGNDYDYLLTMPIYSLTQERLDRLQAQIAAKKKEHDDLEALSEKDLWCKDLDDFVVEWEAQLALDNEIQSNIRRLGRRVSKKIGAGRGRKDKDDDEYNPILKKAAKATAKTAKVETKTHERFAEKFLGASKASKPSSSAPVKDESDGFSDGDYAMLSRNKPAAKPTDDADGEARRGRRTAASKPAKYAEESESDFNDDDDDDDGFTFKPTSTVTTTKVPVAKPSDASDGEAAKPKQRLVSSTVAPSRTKPVWLEDDSDTDGSRLLGDVGAMVKGIGKSDTEGANGNGGRLSLFAMSTSRPESSHGSALPKTIRTKPSRNFDDDGPDDTNYEMLAKSPQRGPSGAALTGVDLVNSLLSDDDDMPPVKGPTAAVAKVSVNTAASLVKNPKRRPAGTTAASKTKSNPAPATSQPKAVQLSPAAKAFAQKKAKKTFSFSDDEDDAPARSAAAPPARERPARAAASKPKKPLYVDSDDDDDFGGGDDGDDYDMSD